MKKILLTIMGVLMLSLTTYTKEIEIIYPNRDGVGEKAYGYQILKLILPKIGKNYKIKLVNEFSNQDRALSELKKGNYSIVDTGISEEFEEDYEPIYIPIDMGLTGWRLLIINNRQKREFAKIESGSQLKIKLAGQGTGWVDAQILKSQGFRVLESPKVENLMTMVEKGRIDYLPLGANEINKFLMSFGNKEELIIENTLVLHYPFARIFYVKKGNKELAADIKLGLEKAYLDGSFKEFIYNYSEFSDILKDEKLKKRKVINITNPYMTEKFKQIDPKWWY